jgi:PKHD-type hydroxylase
MLLHIPQLLTPEDLRTIAQWMQTAPWEDGRHSAGSQAQHAKNNQQLPRDCEAARHTVAMVMAALDRSAQFLTATLPRKVFPPRINRYSGSSNYYGPHVDGAIRPMPSHHGAAPERMRTDISCTVFLSDPDDYDGGELCMQSDAGQQKIKLPAGHAVIYPAGMVHEVLPVTRGERLACFFWVESMIQSTEQRRLLYDMDMALLALRSQHGESPQTVALTNTYHNLLRMWGTP